MCSFVATPAEFRREGCPNCDNLLEVSRVQVVQSNVTRDQYAHPSMPQMKGSADRVIECTTAQFDGTIALVSPEDSWVVSSGSSTRV